MEFITNYLQSNGIRTMSLFHCTDSLAWILIILSALTCILYIMATWSVFFKMYKVASNDHKIIWIFVIIIFHFCALGGYGTTILAGWYPEIAYIAKVIIITLNIMFCLMLLGFSKGVNVHIETKGDAVKKKDLVEFSKQFEQLVKDFKE